MHEKLIIISVNTTLKSDCAVDCLLIQTHYLIPHIHFVYPKTPKIISLFFVIILVCRRNCITIDAVLSSKQKTVDRVLSHPTVAASFIIINSTLPSVAAVETAFSAFAHTVHKF